MAGIPIILCSLMHYNGKHLQSSIFQAIAHVATSNIREHVQRLVLISHISANAQFRICSLVSSDFLTPFFSIGLSGLLDDLDLFSIFLLDVRNNKSSTKQFYKTYQRKYSLKMCNITRVLVFPTSN